MFTPNFGAEVGYGGFGKAKVGITDSAMLNSRAPVSMGS